MSFFKKKSKSKGKKKKGGASSQEEQRRKMQEMYAKAAGVGANDHSSAIVTPESPSTPDDTSSQLSNPTPSPIEPGTTVTTKLTQRTSSNDSDLQPEYRFTYTPYIVPEISKGKFIAERHLAAARQNEQNALQQPSLVTQFSHEVSKSIDLIDAVPLYPWLKGIDTTIFRGAGEKAGIEVWQLFGMRPEPVMRHHYGSFNSGDCYIVLKTFDAQDELERLRKVHMWMGKDANNTKRAICAYMTYELCNRLHGSATQYLQEEGEEDMEFINYFPKVEYANKTSSEETLRPVELPDSDTVLIRIVEEGRLYAKRIPLRPLSDLDRKGVYVLVTSNFIYVYMGTESAESTRIKGIDVGTTILHEEKKGGAELRVVMQDCASDEEFQMVKFLTQAESQSKKENTECDVARLHALLLEEDSEGNLAVKVQEIRDRPLTRSMLDTTGTYVLETLHDIYVWFGYQSSMFSRYFAKKLVQKIQEGHPHLSVHIFFQDGEHVLFKERFESGFYMVETPETYEQRMRQLSNVSRRDIFANIPAYFDEFTESRRQKKYFDEEDDGGGAVRMFRVIDSKKAVPVPESELGQFYSGECYLILYEFNRNDVVYMTDDEYDDDEYDDGYSEYDDDDGDEEADGGHDSDYSFDDNSVEAKLAMIRNNPAILQCEEEDLAPSKTFEEQIREAEERRKREEEEQLRKLEQEMAELDTRNRFPSKDKSAKKKKIFYLTRKILYCWEGSQSENKVNARILKENFMGLATDPINPARVVTLEEGKETDHFLQVFEHAMVVHNGKYDQRDASDMRLYRIYCKTVINSRAIEVPKRMSSLNSNDVFVLVGVDTAWVWCGMFASNTKKRIALKFGQVLCAGREVTAVEEGLVPEEFFEDLSEFEEDYVREKLRYSQGIVYHCCVTSENRFRILDIGEVGKNFLKDDLDLCQTTMMFDFGSVLYVWYPRPPTEAERILALRAANAMVEEDDDDEHEDGGSKPKTPSVKIVETQRGEEPIAFQQGFPQWHPPREFVDTFALRVEEELKRRSDMVRRSLPFLRLMREKYSYLLTNDEYVNVENMLYFIDVARKADRNFELLVATLENTHNVEWEDVTSFAADVLKFYMTEFAAEDHRRAQVQK